MLCPSSNQPEHDLVMTPPHLAERIVNHFKPRGRVLDPCRGQGAFYDAIAKQPGVEPHWCEITQGRDFFEETGHFDWLITNPPWSKLRKFLLHAMPLADNIVLLATLTHFDTRARDMDIYQGGFGRREAVLVHHPGPPWPSSGFLLCAYHLQRGYTGPLYFTRDLLKSRFRGFFG
jgi:hypothetical protein